MKNVLTIIIAIGILIMCVGAGLILANVLGLFAIAGMNMILKTHHDAAVAYAIALMLWPVIVIYLLSISLRLARKFEK